MKKTFSCVVLATVPTFFTFAHAFDDAKIATVKQVMSQVDDRIDIISQNATDDFLEVIEIDYAITPDGIMNCAPWDWIAGQDPSQYAINKTATYKILNNGNVRVRFKSNLDGPYETLDFVVVKSGNGYLIDDIYDLDQDTYFKPSTVGCWVESGYL